MSTQTRERRERILQTLYEEGRVDISTLAKSLETSEASVRRDLRLLTKNHPITLVYGGALLTKSVDYSFRTKSVRNVEAKRVIGRLAADMVADGDTILLDSGTTCFAMVPFIKRKRNLSVIVNSSRLATEVDVPGMRVVFIGGNYRPDRMDCVGPLANNMIGMLRGYRSFIGVDGLGMDFGLTASDIESAELRRLAVRNSLETTVLADNTKFLSPSLYKIVDFDVVSRIVTDKAPSTEWSEFLTARSISLIYPGAKDDRT